MLPYFLMTRLLSLINKKYLIVQKVKVSNKKRLTQNTKLIFLLFLDHLFTFANVFILFYAQKILNEIIISKFPFFTESSLKM